MNSGFRQQASTEKSALYEINNRQTVHRDGLLRTAQPNLFDAQRNFELEIPDHLASFLKFLRKVD